MTLPPLYLSPLDNVPTCHTPIIKAYFCIPLSLNPHLVCTGIANLFDKLICANTANKTQYFKVSLSENL